VAEGQTAFVHARVFDGTRVLGNQTVVIEGGVIAAVGGKPPKGYTVIDARGKTLLPGLIDSYGDTKGAEAALNFGVTTIVSPQDWVQLIYDDGFAWGQRHPSAGFIALNEEVDRQHKDHKHVMVEVGSLRESMEALSAEADGLVRIFAGVRTDPELVKLFLKRKAFLIPVLTMIDNASGLATGERLAADPRVAGYLTAEQQASLKERVPGKVRIEGSFLALHELYAARVPMLAGDGFGNPGTVAGASLHQELELMVRGIGMKPVEALVAATSRPAEIFGLKDRGVIAKGKRADLLLVKGNPTRSILATRDIVGVWKQGERVIRRCSDAAGCP